MKFLAQIAHKALYYGAYPLLRLYYQRVAPPRDTVRAIVLCKGEVLLVRNIGVSYWSLPGGAFHTDETAHTGLMRELKEELEITNAQSIYLLGSYEGSDRNIRVFVHIYVLEVNSFLYKKQWEIDEARWFPVSHVPSNLSPATRARLREYTAGKQNLQGEW